MPNFCPECGAKLEGEFNFCPNCGTELNEHLNSVEEVENSNESVNEITKEKLVCENCGEENDADAETCRSCGVNLSNNSSIKTIKVEAPKSEPKKRVSHKSSSPKQNKNKNKKLKQNINQKNQTQTTVNKPKNLDSKKLFMISSILVAIVLVILFASGIFDRPEIPVEQNFSNSQTQQQSSGVSLEHVQKINELENTIKANPKDYQSILQLANLQNDSKMYQKAIENYKKYLEAKPKDADARIDMGVCYYSLQDYNTAISEMEKALKYAPDNQIGYLNLGVVNLAAGNVDKSKEWLQKAIKINPGSEMGKKAQELLNSHQFN